MLTTLVDIEKDEKYLMLYRNKKENNLNKGKWIGVGGKFLENESPLQCAVREVKEETGLTIYDPDFRGVVVFNYNEEETEYMFLYTADKFTGEVDFNCNEGELKWIDKDDILNLNLWEGDRIFLSLLKKDSPFFYLTLNYRDDTLLNHSLEFRNDDFALFEGITSESQVQSIIRAYR